MSYNLLADELVRSGCAWGRLQEVLEACFAGMGRLILRWL
jgi:hypothetical protein